MLSGESQLRPLSVEDVYRMADAGILGEEERVELVDGLLVTVARSSPEHSAAVTWLNRHFANAVGEREVRVQDVLLVEGGFFLADLMVVDPPPRDQHPATAALVVEVCVTTHRHDASKAHRYARAGVAEYWIVDLPARTITVHRDPRTDGYRLTARHVDGDRIATAVGAGDIDVTALLG